MGVAVLKPEDCLKLPDSMKRPKNPHPNPNRMNRTQSNRRKRSQNTSPPSRSTGAGPKAPALVMGQVKILKRGEDLKQAKPTTTPVEVDKENVGADPVPTSRKGPDSSQTGLTESTNKANNVVPSPFYAGSAFITSPDPSSVPLPGFFTKKIGVSLKGDVASDLRRILRLDV